ncbi:MAG: hypothetical protein M1828_001788 [Chrysothrix sp. TS-e1954]|nr:MAG: hypothetical protein M1828_001788 [Chrysothrix sp. TS-e1954]
MAKPRLTHFICVPIVTSASRPPLEAGLERLRNEIAHRPQLAGLDNAVRPIGVLHLTLGVMSLTQPDRVDAAIRKLKDLDLASMLRQADSSATSAVPSREPQDRDRSDEVVIGREKAGPSRHTQSSKDGTAIYVSFEATSSMHDPKKTSILYTDPVDKSGRLYNFCNSIKSAFEADGLLVDENRALKLHVTILNTIYGCKITAKKDQDAMELRNTSLGPNVKGHARGRREPAKFDARELLEAMNEQMLVKGQYRLQKLALCKMGAEKIRDEKGNVVDERYEEIAVRDLPV